MAKWHPELPFQRIQHVRKCSVRPPLAPTACRTRRTLSRSNDTVRESGYKVTPGSDHTRTSRPYTCATHLSLQERYQYTSTASLQQLASHGCRFGRGHTRTRLPAPTTLAAPSKRACGRSSRSVAGQTKQASKWPAAGAVDWSNVPVLSCPVVPDLTTTRQMLQACVRACLSFRRPCAVIPVCSVRIRICIRLPCRCSPTIEQIPGLSAKQFRLQAPARSTTTNVACIAKKLKSYSQLVLVGTKRLQSHMVVASCFLAAAVGLFDVFLT